MLFLFHVDSLFRCEYDYLLFLLTPLGMNVASLSLREWSFYMNRSVTFSLSLNCSWTQMWTCSRGSLWMKVRRCEEMDRKLSELLSEHCWRNELKIIAGTASGVLVKFSGKMFNTLFLSFSVLLCFLCLIMLFFFFSFQGFVEKEIKKANIPVVDTGENPEVPFPRDMIDLEV